MYKGKKLKLLVSEQDISSKIKDGWVHFIISSVTDHEVEINPKWDFMYFIKIVNNDKQGIIYPDLNKETPYIFVNLIR